MTSRLSNALCRRDLRAHATLLCAALLLALVPVSAEARTVQTLVTKSGIGIWLVEDHGVPIISLGFAIRGGAVADPEGLEGLGDLTANMLSEGAGELDADAFKGELDRLGATLSFGVSRRALNGGLVTLSKHRERAFELLRLAINAPRLEAAAFARLKAQERSSLAFENRRAGTIALQAFLENAFHGHPYARRVKGTDDTLAKIEVEDVRSHLTRVVGRDGLHVVVVGDISAEAASESVERIFGGLAERSQVAVVSPVAITGFHAVAEAPKGQSLETAAIGLPMPGLADGDFFAGLALNHILGSGNFDARLTKEIRVARGLTYSIRTSVFADDATAYSLGVFSTKPGNMERALDAITQTLDDLRTGGPTNKEVHNAVAQLVGNYVLDLTTSQKLAAHLVGLWIDGLAPDYGERRRARLQALSVEDVHALARRRLDPAQLRVLVLKPSEETTGNQGLSAGEQLTGQQP